MSNSPASAPQGSSNLMGGQMTPTATPIVRPNPATAFRPTVTPSIYDEWKGYTDAAQASNAANKAEAGGGIVQSGPYKGMTIQDASKFDNFTILNPEYAKLAAGYR